MVDECAVVVSETVRALELTRPAKPTSREELVWLSLVPEDVIVHSRAEAVNLRKVV